MVPLRPSTPTQMEARDAVPSTLSATEIYEIPKRRPSEDDDDADDVADDGFVEADAQDYGREKFGAVAGSYITPYL